MKEESSQESLLGDPRVYLAAERTFLAWLRTGTALMVFGFVVARLPLVLHELAYLDDHITPPEPLLPGSLGVLLIALGIGMNVGAVIRHWRYVRGIDQGKIPRSGHGMTVTCTTILTLVGIGIIYYILMH